MQTILKQYDLVREMREVLFTYLSSLSTADYTREVANFGRGSIRDTQLHIANTYRHWIGNFGLQLGLPFSQKESIVNVSDMKKEYQSIDKLMEKFFETFTNDTDKTLTNTLSNNRKITLTPLKLVTHVFTHEFHHKGQIMSMSRTLGYTPPDTDLIRFQDIQRSGSGTQWKGNSDS